MINPKNLLNFSLEKEHPTIMQEAYFILEKVIKPPQQVADGVCADPCQPTETN